MAENISVIRQGAWKIWLSEGCEQRISGVVELICRDFSPKRDLLTIPGFWKIHGGGRSSIYGVESSGERFCIKVFNDARLQARVRTFLGWSKGRRAFTNGLRARNKNIPVPPVFAYVEKRPFGPTMVLMQLLDAMQMNLLIEDMLSRGVELTNDTFFGRMVESFGRFTRDMHQNSVCHADFSPRNVLVAMDGEHIHIKLIDLEDVFFSSRVADFKENIDHFSRKMARYVNQDAMAVFLQRFKETYGE